MSRLLGLMMITLRLAVNAQDFRSDTPESCCSERAPNWVVKFAPLSLFDPDNTVQFGIEQLLERGHAVQAEFGYGRQSFGFWDVTSRGRYASRDTWRGRAEWRLYFWKNLKSLGPYLAIEGFYKQGNARETSIGGIPCLGPCVPGVVGQSPALKHVWGGHLKAGYQRPVSSDNRLLLDVYSGIGIRYRQVSRPDLPAGIILQEPPALFSSLPAFPVKAETAISLSLGLKLGYTF